jgi:hypothetical protein
VMKHEGAQFEHDCRSCHFLGTYEKHDLYFCRQGGSFPTIVARYGDKGPEYLSGLAFRNTYRSIAEGFRRAVGKELISEGEGFAH